MIVMGRDQGGTPTFRKQRKRTRRTTREPSGLRIEDIFDRVKMPYVAPTHDSRADNLFDPPTKTQIRVHVQSVNPWVCHKRELLHLVQKDCIWRASQNCLGRCPFKQPVRGLKIEIDPDPPDMHHQQCSKTYQKPYTVCTTIAHSDTRGPAGPMFNTKASPASSMFNANVCPALSHTPPLYRSKYGAYSQCGIFAKSGASCPQS